MEELIPMTMFVCIAMVMILRPISKRIGALLEVMTRERLQPPAAPAVPDPQLARIASLLENVGRRMDLMEERLDFTERLVGSTRRGLAAPDESPGSFGDVRLMREPMHGLRR
ncbi:MAG TPA: hypothetical protein VK939_10090 [Longimicrobiales bacterium]|nr:hypothetical protein [Longimicrobiales bacterium]